MARHVKSRKTYPAIGIVGEGGVERTYFTQLRQFEQLMFTIKPTTSHRKEDRNPRFIKSLITLEFCER